jgi:hypothetical protein
MLNVSASSPDEAMTTAGRVTDLSRLTGHERMVKMEPAAVPARRQVPCIMLPFRSGRLSSRLSRTPAVTTR